MLQLQELSIITNLLYQKHASDFHVDLIKQFSL